MNQNVRLTVERFMSAWCTFTLYMLLGRKIDTQYVVVDILNFLLRNYSIKSKNFLLGNTILIKQIEGPFESFDGEWKVSEIDNQNTEVTFKAEFQLPFLLNNLLPDKVIDNFCKVAIEAFVDRITKE